jgi:hypothetical protein
MDDIKQAQVNADSKRRSVPLPPDGGEYSRVRGTRARRSMLDGNWASLLAERTRAVLGTERAGMQADPSLSLNPFKSTCRTLAVLYDGEPTINHQRATAEDLSTLTARLRRAALWPTMQRTQLYCLGLREMFKHVAVDPSDPAGALIFRDVYPDMVIARATEARPDVPARIEELRERSADFLRSKGIAIAANADKVWTVDLYDLSGPQPVHAVYLLSGNGTGQTWGLGADITEQVYGRRMTGEDYPFRATPTQPELRKDPAALGKPILPYVLYHAAPNADRLFDPNDWIELVDGTLNVGVVNGFLLHLLGDASWPQKYLIGGMPIAAKVQMESGDDSAPRVQYVPSDPTSVLIIANQPDFTGQPSAGQWEPGGSIMEVETVLANMISALMESAGIPASDIQRLSGNARSGAALSITNEGKRELQRRYQPIFENADQQLIRICAILLNRHSDAIEAEAKAAGDPIPPRYRYPEGGYSLTYAKIPRSPSELKEHREHVLALLDRGMMSPVEAYAALNDVPVEIAAVRLLALQAEANAAAAARTPAPTATPAPTNAPAPEQSGADSVMDDLDDIIDDIDDGATPAEIRAALIALRGSDPNASDDTEDAEDPSDPPTAPPADG